MLMKSLQVVRRDQCRASPPPETFFGDAMVTVLALFLAWSLLAPCRVISQHVPVLGRDFLQGVVRGWHDRLPGTVNTVKVGGTAVL